MTPYNINPEKRTFYLELLNQAQRNLKETEKRSMSNPASCIDNDVTLIIAPVIQIKVPIKKDQRKYAALIMNTVCRLHGLKPTDILRKDKSDPVALCRHMTAGLMYEKTWLSFEVCGQIMGGRNHATIMSSHEENFDLCFTNKAYKKLFDQCRAEVEKYEGTEIRMKVVNITKEDL